jgi:fumarate reductase subunit C
MMQIFESARSVVGKADLTDLEKEKRMRSLAIESIKAFMSVLLSLAAVAAATIISAIAVAALTGVDTDALIDFSLNPVVLLLTVVAVSIAQWAFRRRAK